MAEVSGGWVKIHRKIWDNPVVTKDSDHLAVWIWLLTHATHQPHDTLFCGKRITLQPGQLVTGRKKIATELCTDEYKVARVLKLFKSEQQIAQQATSHGSLITILNWHKYQMDAQQNAQQMHSQCTTTAQQLHTKQECKNERRDISVTNVTLGRPSRADRAQPYDPAFNQTWKLTPRHNGRLEGKKPAFAAYRRSIKAGHTPEEIRSGIEALAKRYERDGEDPRYIPKGSTIYNQELWADALAETGKSEADIWDEELDQILKEATEW